MLSQYYSSRMWELTGVPIDTRTAVTCIFDDKELPSRGANARGRDTFAFVVVGNLQNDLCGTHIVP